MLATAPGARLSATIAAFSAALQRRRRGAPVRTSTRRKLCPSIGKLLGKPASLPRLNKAGSSVRPQLPQYGSSVSLTIDKHGIPVDFLLTAKRDLGQPNASSARCCGTNPYSRPTGSARMAPVLIRRLSWQPGRRAPAARALHYVSKHLQQGIESDHSHGHVRGQGSGLGVHGSSPAVGSDPRSEPVPMTRWCAAPDQTHIRSPLVAAARTSAFGGWGSGGRDHSSGRLLRPMVASVRPPGSGRTDQVRADGVRSSPTLASSLLPR